MHNPVAACLFRHTGLAAVEQVERGGYGFADLATGGKCDQFALVPGGDSMIGCRSVLGMGRFLARGRAVCQSEQDGPLARYV